MALFSLIARRSNKHIDFLPTIVTFVHDRYQISIFQTAPPIRARQQSLAVEVINLSYLE